MNQITRINQIDVTLLNQGEFFQSLFQELCTKKLLTDTQIEKIQLELIQLLGKQVERYTNGESSSVRVEKAQEILKSITYCIGLYLKRINSIDEIIELLDKESVTSLFHRGTEEVIKLMAQAATLYQNLKINRLSVNNYSYQDTISDGISQFFKEYQVEFEAFETSASIDYQLMSDVNDLCGVEYINEYLRRLTMENDFLRRFSESKIALLLHGFHKDSEHMLINIFELVLTNVLGCEMAGIPMKELNISEKECSWLDKNLKKMTYNEIRDRLMSSLHQIKVEFDLDQDIIAYSDRLIPDLTSRICHNLKTDTLQEVFISFKSHQQQSTVYEDGIPMTDDKLRELIEELRNITNVTEKVYMIREKVRSLSDLIELLEECFYGKEYKEVFQLLLKPEREILKNKLIEEAGVTDQAEYQPEQEWQKILFEKN